MTTSAASPAGLATADIYQLLQTVIGFWPEAQAQGDAGLADRLEGWCRKYLREAKLRSSWDRPDQPYEDRFCAFARQLAMAPPQAPFAQARAALLRQIAADAEAKSLVQAVLRYTVPGVPDLYQGCECPDLSLVDPDNRRPVDFAARAKSLGAQASAKQHIIAALLAARARAPDLWARGDYQPLAVHGPGAAQMLAFRRAHGDAALVVLVRHGVDEGPGWLVLDGPHSDLLTGREFSAGEARDLLATYPAAVLIRR